MRAIFIWFTCSICMVVILVAAYLWLDRPIALFVYTVFRHSYPDAFSSLRHYPDPLIPLALLVFVVLGLLAFAGRVFSRHETAAFLCCISITVTEAIKDGLKFVFGRTWPQAWTSGGRSFLQDQIYGFHLFHGGTDYQSFPSGHMAASSAALSILWLRYPQLRWLWATAFVVVGGALVAGNFHFLSDVIAGAFVGVSVGLMVIAVWNQGGQTP